MVWYQIYRGINIFLNIVSVLLGFYCLMTWFARPGSPLYTFIHRLVEPIVGPFRPLALRLMEKGLMIDISVLLALAAVRLAGWAVNMIFTYLIF